MVTGSRLHLVGPLGFSLDEKSLYRAGLGYWESLDVTVHESWEAFLDVGGRTRACTCSPRRPGAPMPRPPTQTATSSSLGASVGLPEVLLAAHAHCCERIPMLPDAASLDNASSWGAGEKNDHAALLAQDVCGNFVDPEDYRISALNLSNAAAVVLYEALRQTGFA